MTGGGLQKIGIRMRKRKSPADPVKYTGALLMGMVLILAAQLTWWVRFYEIGYDNTDIVQERLDGLITSVANGEKIDLSPYRDDLEKIDNNRYRISPQVIRRREEEHRRWLFMLISETLFVLSVIAFGSFRILRSVKEGRRLSKERSIFINSVTHELKTPLTTLLLNIQTILKRKLPENSRRELLEDSVENIRRLENQVNNLLLGGELSRLRNESDSHLFYTEEPELYDCTSLIEDYIQSIESDLSKQEAKISFEKSGTCFVKLNPSLFRKVLGNLIGNAIQYNDKNPEISISIKEKKYRIRGRICIMRIRDNGYGIPQKELKNIFKPFYRLGNDSRSIRGTGIGLYLVQEIIEAAKGNVSAISEGSGKGTTIIIRLPAYDRQTAK